MFIYQDVLDDKGNVVAEKNLDAKYPNLRFGGINSVASTFWKVNDAVAQLRNLTLAYALPKAWTPGVVGVLADVIAGRGLGGVFCYEDQVRQMDNVTHFIELNRLDHPMDVYFCPEALEHELSLANHAY